MITLLDAYHVIAATVPLYVAMILAYLSVKWWKLFTPEQCAGINKFVAKFSIPLLSFQVISDNNPYAMNVKLIIADFLQKLLAVLILTAITRFGSRKRGLNWVVTGLSLSTLPNTLILGIPLLRAMYGSEAGTLVAQIVVLQSLVWYNLMLFLFELSAAKAAYVTPSPADDAGNIEAPVVDGERKDIQQSEDMEQMRTPKHSKTMIILCTVGRKLFSNPNTHATILGLIWSSIRYKWGVKFPEIIDKSISILSIGGLGMAMFSLGLFMASQTSIIACGKRMASIAMAMKFFGGPLLMAASSIAIGARGTLLKVAIVQAALPQGIVPFVFAKEYNVHPAVLSTGVLFGLLIALPIALTYYFMLGL